MRIRCRIYESSPAEADSDFCPATAPDFGKVAIGRRPDPACRGRIQIQVGILELRVIQDVIEHGLNPEVYLLGQFEIFE